MGHYDDPELAGPRRARVPVLLASVLAALLVGAAAGYLLRLATEPAPPPPPVAAPAPPAAPSELERTPCAQAAASGSDIVAQLREGASAIGRLDPAGLQRVLDEVQRLQGELERGVAVCREMVTTPPAGSAPQPPRASPEEPPAAPAPTG